MLGYVIKITVKNIEEMPYMKNLDECYLDNNDQCLYDKSIQF
jgi:hypothetical protein